MAQNDSQFIKTVLAYYNQHGRHTLPWRKTSQPYRIVVSEIMLQQTQVERVLPKYQLFLRHFPNTKQLATARLAEVLTVWQGLGYNRRAKLLQQCAAVVTREYHGRWPDSFEALQTLPGIGPYTAGAIMAYAYNQAVPIIETNIRSVYLHHYFPHATAVTELQILQRVQAHIALIGEYDTDPRTWYSALMDYGTHLKKLHGNPNHRAKNYSKQKTFVGSDRQVRGAIIRELTTGAQTKRKLQQKIAFAPKPQLDSQLTKLVTEGMVLKKNARYHLPT